MYSPPDTAILGKHLNILTNPGLGGEHLTKRIGAAAKEFERAVVEACRSAWTGTHRP